MTEPNYEYVKGQGWVVVTNAAFQRVIGNWLFTLERRKPKKGERWIPWDGAPEPWFDAIIKNNPGVFTFDKPPMFGFVDYFNAGVTEYVIKISRA